MTVTVSTFGVQVLLKKLVHRQDGVAARYAAGSTDIDLTPYLGTAGSIRTQKGLVEPAGAFSITFADAVSPDIGDTFYALIEPMDLIEIRATRSPEDYVGQNYPLIMRGFVSAVRRVESIGDDGTPRRVVNVMGQDSGKLWQINQVIWELLQVTDSPFLNTYHMQAVTGIQVSMLPVSDFMTQLVTSYVNPKVQTLAAFASNLVAPFVADCSVKQGIVSVSTAAMFDSQPVWNLAVQFADRPWNEIFIQDQEDGPHLVFRPAPLKDINGQFIDPDATDPGSFYIDVSAILSLDLVHTDSRVANFFWVPPGQSTLDTDGQISKAYLISGQPLDFSYGNNRPELYGVRKMQVGSNLLPDGNAPMPVNVPGSQYTYWYSQRAALLKNQNRDNCVFEEGVAAVQGNELMVPGQYAVMTRGDLTAEYYAVSVAHDIAPLRTWTSSLSLVRGTGFLNRNQASGAPAWLEGRSGPYSR